MATHTTNYNLSKPEASDAFSAFRQSYNDNMDIIDANLGGGGGGGSVNDVEVNGVSVVVGGVAEVTVPTQTSDLNNDSGFLTSSDVSAVAMSGDYDDLLNKPTIPTATSDLVNDSDFVSDASYVHTDNNFTTALKDKLDGIEAGAEVNVQADWNEADSTDDAFIKNKPTIPTATSDLVNDSGFTAVSVTQIQTTGTKIAEIDVDGVTTDIYAPTGGGGTVTDVEVNGTSVVTGGVAEVTVPTATSELNNDSDFVSDASYVHTDNNFTTAEKTKLSGIESGAEVNVQSDWSQSDNTADDYIKNKPSIPTNTSDLNNDSGFLDSSDITVTQIQTTGTKIATIDVDGTSTDIYAPSGGGGGGLPPRLFVHSDTGSTVTAVLGGDTITGVEIETGIFQCDLTDYGDWTINGVLDGTPMTTIMTIDAVKEYTINFVNGSTVTPTDDITILLQCAGIYDSTITTIQELLADDTTLLTVISSNNAIDYLVRSTTFATAISQNQTAMGYIGLDDYASNTLLADSTWVVAIGSSGYSDLVLNVKNPNMTSASTPSGRVNGTSTWSTLDAYKAFDGSQTSYALFNTSTMWVYYQFIEPVKICKITLKNNGRSGAGDNWQYFIKVFKIQGSNDGSNWTDLFSGQTTAQAGSTSNSFYFNNTNEYLYYRIVRVSAWGDTANTCIGELTYYGRKNVSE